MTDGSSQEFSRGEIKSEPHKSPEAFAKRINPLGMPEVNYNELPGSFEVGEELTGAAALLRHRTETEKTEVGGVLMKDQEGKLRFMAAGKGDAWSISLRPVEITNENLKSFGEIVKNNHEKITTVVFTSKKIADGNQEYFKSLIDIGVEVVLDRVPAARLHSHPSNSLPSSHDFGQTLFWPGLFTENNIPEIVVTPEYTYLLFPTKQTKYLSDDDLSKNGIGIISEWEEAIDNNKKRLNEIDEINGIKIQNKEGHSNALLYNFLRNHCPEYNVGFYALKNGEKTAQRVF